LLGEGDACFPGHRSAQPRQAGQPLAAAQRHPPPDRWFPGQAVPAGWDARPDHPNPHPAVVAAAAALAQPAAHHPLVVAVGVLGIDLVLLTPRHHCPGQRRPELVRASYLAMGLLADAVLVPLALEAPLTGILLGLGTAWGLTRHTRVLAKLVLTIGVATAAVLVLRPALHRAAEQALQVSLAELPTTGIGRLGVAVTLAPRGRATAAAAGHRDPGGLQALGPHTIRPHGRDQQMTPTRDRPVCWPSLSGSPASEGYAVRRGSR
jgi:hypothetical protein